jgi:hypothetical protein
LMISSQNDQSTGDIKVIGGDDLSTLTGKVSIEMPYIWHCHAMNAMHT